MEKPSLKISPQAAKMIRQGINPFQNIFRLLKKNLTKNRKVIYMTLRSFF